MYYDGLLIDSDIGNVVTPEVEVIKAKVEREIELGLQSPTQGWAMSEILSKFSVQDREVARAYILKRSGKEKYI